jgi:hypothetical protein
VPAMHYFVRSRCGVALMLASIENTSKSQAHFHRCEAASRGSGHGASPFNPESKAKRLP